MARAAWSKGATLSAAAVRGDSGGGSWQPFTFTRVEATLATYVPIPRRSVLALTVRAGLLR